jgi:hypothetical protein
MAEFDDNEEEFDDADAPEHSAEEREAAIERMVAALPPELYPVMQPLLMMSQLANHALLGHADDPVPQALKELLDYDHDFVREVIEVHDTPSLGRLLATRMLPMFDFLLVARLVFDSPLEPPLRAYLNRNSPTDADDLSMRDYVLGHGETMLDNFAQYLTGGDADLEEELRMRRLQTESIFARLGDTLRMFYPPGHSPEELEAERLDAQDEAEDAEAMAASIRFNSVQLLTLGTALKLPTILIGLDETPFGRALATVPRFRKKALERLAARMQEAEPSEEFALTWSELLRLYQAAQVCALSVVADVFWVGSIEDVMLNGGPRNPDDGYEPEGPGLPAEEARQTREMLTAIMSGFVELIEENYPDEEEVLAAKAEISQLAELLA